MACLCAAREYALGEPYSSYTNQALQCIRAVERHGNVLEVPEKRLLGAGTAVTVDGPALPEGWAAAKDAQGRTYFWHKATKKVQWDRPTAESVAA